MLTIKADADPPMNRVEKLDPRLADDRQDKRSVAGIESKDYERWLDGSLDNAKALIHLASTSAYTAAPDR
jgi:hypothetical protein